MKENPARGEINLIHKASGELDQVTMKFNQLEALIFRLNMMLVSGKLEPDNQEMVSHYLEFIRNNFTALNYTIDQTPQGRRISYKMTLKADSNKEQAKAILQSTAVSFAIADIMGSGQDFIDLLREKEEEIAALKKKLNKKEGKRQRSRKKPEKILLGHHHINQMFHPQKDLQLSLWEGERWQEENIEPSSARQKLDQVGLSLNDAQLRVWEAIVGCFSQTNYEGDKQTTIIESMEMEQSEEDLGEGIKKAYKNAGGGKLPVITITQADLVKLSGFNAADKGKALEALNYLGTKQHAFFWDRLAKDKEGNPVIGTDKKYKMEQVMEVGTLFRVKHITDKETGRLKHYEIHPSAVVVDQVTERFNGPHYFVLPGDWREKVKAINPGKKASPYLYRFILWLRSYYSRMIQKEGRRRGGKAWDGKVINTWVQIAQILQMPETMYRSNKKRTAEMVRGFYEIAKKANYLTDYTLRETGDILTFNNDYLSRSEEAQQ